MKSTLGEISKAPSTPFSLLVARAISEAESDTAVLSAVHEILFKVPLQVEQALSNFALTTGEKEM